VTDGAWRVLPGGIEIRARVTPRAGRDAIEGVATASDGRPALAMRVRAAPSDGAATDAVRRLIADALGRPGSAVTLKAGAGGRLKTFVVAGDGVALSERLAALVGEGGR
jgi:uncharacterized protein